MIAAWLHITRPVPLIPQSDNYWSSTPSGSKAWNVNVNLDDSNANANFNEDDTSNPYNVLGCLAYWVKFLLWF